MDRNLTLITCVQDGEGRLFALLGRVHVTKDFWCRTIKQIEIVGILDIGAGRAFTLTGEDLGECRNQAMIDGTSRILKSGGWPRSPEGEPLPGLETLEVLDFLPALEDEK